jgi:hypothetical protein
MRTGFVGHGSWASAALDISNSNGNKGNEGNE